MPIRDDLVQRTLEALGSALAQLVRRPASVAVDEVRSMLDRAYLEHLGASGDTLRRLPSAQLLAVISTTGSVDAERAYLAGALLELDAATPGTDADLQTLLQVRALDLYTEAGAARVGEADLAERIRRLRAALLDRVLPEATYGRLLHYLMVEGQFAVAEDLLFEWLEEHGPTVTLLQTGERLYDDLERADDAALIAGDLPRDELDEGRATFRRSCAG